MTCAPCQVMRVFAVGWAYIWAGGMRVGVMINGFDWIDGLGNGMLGL